MTVPPLIVKQGFALSGLLGRFKIDTPRSSRFRRQQSGRLQGVQGHPGVTARRMDDMFQGLFIYLQIVFPQPSLFIRQCSLDNGKHFLLGQRPQSKYLGT